MIKNNVMNFLTGKGGAFTMLTVLVVFLAGCLDDDLGKVEPTPLSLVAIYHAAPDAPGLDILVDNNRINTKPFSYSEYSGYLNFNPGSRNLKFNSANAASALIDTIFNLADGKAYSVFVINRLSSLEMLVVKDSSAVPASGKAMVRFVHLSPDAPAVDVSVSGENSALFANASFKNITEFKAVDAKTYSFQLKQAGSDDILVSAGDVVIRAGGYYTILTRGFANPPSGNTNVLSIEIL